MSDDDNERREAERQAAARCRRRERLRRALHKRVWLELETLPDDHSLADELNALERLIEA